MTHSQFQVGMFIKRTGVRGPASVVTAVSPDQGAFRLYPHGFGSWSEFHSDIPVHPFTFGGFNPEITIL